VGDWEEAEKKQIAWHRDQGCNLCNTTDGGEGASPGHPKSSTTKAKLSKANKGRVHTAEARANMSAAKRGRGPVLTEASYRKMADTKRGKPGPKLSPQVIARRNAAIKEAWQKKIASGWNPLYRKGQTKKATQAITGKSRSQEVKDKISAANKGRGLGRKLSAETRAKMSKAQRKRQEKSEARLSVGSIP
jgi:hypothetical protein